MKVTITVVVFVVIGFMLNTCSLAFLGNEIQLTELIGNEYFSIEGNVYLSFYSPSAAYYIDGQEGKSYTLSQENGFIELKSDNQAFSFLCMDLSQIYSLSNKMMLFLEVPDEA
jgi:hypothetical protein